jgi:ubiquinone/menaquinone biosynthesis C-methylase UbiE
MATAFDRLANEYDRWFDLEESRPLFETETACLRDLMGEGGTGWLEVGVGTGRFAQALGVEDGIDPSAAMLEFAARRGIRTKQGSGEALPYQDASFNGVLMALTLCFVDDPRQVLRECARVLRDEGHLVVGFVPSDSPWGQHYHRKGREGNPFYSQAQFFTCDQVVQMAASAGFDLDRAASCLLSPPDEPLDASRREGIVKDAGFVAMRFVRTRLPRAGPKDTRR